MRNVLRAEVVRNFFERVLHFEIIGLSAIYLYFVLTDQILLIAFLLIALFWLARKIVIGKFSPDALRNPFLTIPILILVALLPISLAVSTNWFLSLPKVDGVILGALFFFAIVNQIQTRDDLARASIWLVAVCLGIAVAGLIGTDWAQGKIIGATFLYDHLPRFIQSIPRSIAGGFARNGVGGTLAFTIPFLAAIGFARGGAVWARQSPEPDSDKNRVGTNQPRFPNTLMMRLPRPYVSFVIFSFIISLVTLALTQSRGGILGTLIGLGCVAIFHLAPRKFWRDKKFAGALIAGAIFFAVLVTRYGEAGLNFFLRLDAPDGTLASRVEVWQRGWMMVQDFPLTGIGIGTYNPIAHLLYPFFIAAPDEIVPHAHNQFLEVAIDLGIPGLIAYLALMIGFAVCLARAYRATQDARLRALAIGLGCGMIAHHIFGLTDAFILGSKPGLVMWIYFGFAAAGVNVAKDASERITENK